LFWIYLGHRGGIEGVRIGLSLYAPSMPSFCPIFTVEQIQSDSHIPAFKKEWEQMAFFKGIWIHISLFVDEI